jgi:hypothetical protein
LTKIHHIAVPVSFQVRLKEYQSALAAFLVHSNLFDHAALNK